MRILLFLLIPFGLSGQPYQPTWESLDTKPIPEWYRDAKFGIFIHWGVYAVPGWCEKGKYAEWYQRGLQTDDTTRQKYQRINFGNRSYYELANDFHAELFKPEDWARLFEASGAKYIVLTSKHHDGYCLWPSATSDSSWGFPWNSMSVGPKRDLIGELFQEVRKTSVHPGLYFSLYEWFNPLYLSDKEKYSDQHAWPQMIDLINRYQPEVFWTDGDWEASDTLWRSREFLAWLYNDSPVKDRVVTMDRWGIGVRFNHGMVYTPEYEPDKDFGGHYFEESRGMAYSYGYNREEDAWDYTSTQALILSLVDKVSRGGNLLLDIGPDAHGKIPPIMQERLLQMGDWLKINGEAIYGTDRWTTTCQWSEGRRDYVPPKENPNMEWRTSGDVILKLTVDPEPGFAVKEIFFTHRRSTGELYAILPSYPPGRKLIVKDFELKAGSTVHFLMTKEELKWKKRGKDIEINLPDFKPEMMSSSSAWVVRIKLAK
ncbi:MAG: alpha-L-fucosidase [Bacteroidota bacterium]